MPSDIRAALKRLRDLGFSFKAILTLADNAGFRVGMGQDALGKFSRNPKGTLEPDHASQLCKFLFTSPMVQGLLLPDSKAATHYHSLMRTLTMGYGASADIDLVGTHWLYHGSFLFADKFVVRALKVSRHPTPGGGMLTFSDYLYDDSEKQKPAKYESFGAVIVVKGRPQFISYNEDNDLGLRLLVCQETHKPRAGITDELRGRMCGMGNDARPYERAALLVRSKSELEEMKRQTGVFTWRDLRPVAKDAFRKLNATRHMVADSYPDPVVDLKPSQ